MLGLGTELDGSYGVLIHMKSFSAKFQYKRTSRLRTTNTHGNGGSCGPKAVSSVVKLFKIQHRQKSLQHL